VLLEFLWVRLQVPETEMSDTVLVALGGDDDETDIEITTSGDDVDPQDEPPDSSMETEADGDVRVEIDRSADEGNAPAYAAYRPRPTVKRRHVQRKHRPAPQRERQSLA
jgi:hypothetical protein